MHARNTSPHPRAGRSLDASFLTPLSSISLTLTEKGLLEEKWGRKGEFGEQGYEPRVWAASGCCSPSACCCTARASFKSLHALFHLRSSIKIRPSVSATRMYQITDTVLASRTVYGGHTKVLVTPISLVDLLGLLARSPGFRLSLLQPVVRSHWRRVRTNKLLKSSVIVIARTMSKHFRHLWIRVTVECLPDAQRTSC